MASFEGEQCCWGGGCSSAREGDGGLGGREREAGGYLCCLQAAESGEQSRGGEGDPAAAEERPQPLPTALEPGSDGGHRTAGEDADLLERAPFEVELHDGCTLAFGEPAQRGIELLAQAGMGFCSEHGCGLPLMELADASGLQGIERDVGRHPVEPWCQGARRIDGADLGRQDEEDRLGGVLRLMEVDQHPAAGAHHQGLMALDQHGEGRLIAGRCETAQQLVVGFCHGSPVLYNSRSPHYASRSWQRCYRDRSACGHRQATSPARISRPFRRAGDGRSCWALVNRFNKLPSVPRIWQQRS